MARHLNDKVDFFDVIVTTEASYFVLGLVQLSRLKARPSLEMVIALRKSSALTANYVSSLSLIFCCYRQVYDIFNVMSGGDTPVEGP